MNMKELTYMYLTRPPTCKGRCPQCLSTRIQSINKRKRMDQIFDRYQPEKRDKALYRCGVCSYSFSDDTVISVYDRLDLIASEVEALKTNTSMFSRDTIIEHILRVFQDASGVWETFLTQLCDNATYELLNAFYNEHVLTPVPIASFEDGLRAKYGDCLGNL